MIDGTAYRRLTSNGVTLIVRDFKPMQRQDNVHDVNGDGEVTVSDALFIINELGRIARGDVTSIALTTATQDNLADVTGDNQITALDALRIINELNRQGLAGNSDPEQVEVQLPYEDRRDAIKQSNDELLAVMVNMQGSIDED